MKVAEVTMRLETSIRLVLAKNTEDIVAAIFIPKFGRNQWEATRVLLNQESGFRPTAINPTSGACGLFQALSCSKMPCGLSYKSEDVICQARWGAGYIADRYQNPGNAEAYHLVYNFY